MGAGGGSVGLVGCAGAEASESFVCLSMGVRGRSVLLHVSGRMGADRQGLG